MLSQVWDSIKRNPVVLGGLAAALEAYTSGSEARAAALLGLSFVVRQFTVPASEVFMEIEPAFEEPGGAG